MKHFRTLAVVLGLSLVTPSCQLFRAKDPSAVVIDAAPAIYSGLVTSLTVLDLLAAQYIRDLPFLPSVEELEMAKENVLRLDEARQSLLAVKEMIDKDEVTLDKLVPHVKVTLDNLVLVVKDLEKVGVKVPSQVKASLEFVQHYVNLLG